MKYFCFAFLFCCLIYCRDTDQPQVIDQTLRLYVQNANGTDLLNPLNNADYYSSVQLKDLEAERDRVSVSTTLKTDAQNKYYIEYLAGAVRILQSGADSDSRIYSSYMAVQFQKNANDPVQEDFIKIYYKWSPTLFQLSKIEYNAKPVNIGRGDNAYNLIIIK